MTPGVGSRVCVLHDNLLNLGMKCKLFLVGTGCVLYAGCKIGILAFSKCLVGYVSSGLQMRKCTVETKVAQVGVLLAVHSVESCSPLVCLGYIPGHSVNTSTLR